MKIIARDLAARYFLDKTKFPSFFPSVYGKQKVNAEGVAVNVYRIWTDKSLRKIVRKSVGEYLGFDGLIVPESGWKQIDKYGDRDVTNEDLIEIQESMAFPIIAPLPSTKLEDAITNANIAKSMTDRHLFLEIPAFWTEEEIAKFVDATGERGWGYGVRSDNVEVAERIVRNVPRSKKIVLFGIHHPAVIPIMASTGVDVFISGAHMRYAEKKLYISEASIRPLSEIKELPCSCKICAEREPEDIAQRADLLAEHNFLQFITEVKNTRNAIAEGRLFEYAKRRALSHPRIYREFKKLVKSEWVAENLPFPKQNSIYLFGDERRPELEVGKRMAEEASVDVKGLAYSYPFGQTYPPILEGRPEPELVVRSVLRYQFGVDVDTSEIRWDTRRGIPRRIYVGGKYVGIIRFSDGFFVPSIEGAKWLLEKVDPPSLRIVLDERGVETLRAGRSPLTNQVVGVDPKLRPNAEVAFTDEEDAVVATGKTLLTAREIREIQGTVVAKIRHRAV